MFCQSLMSILSFYLTSYGNFLFQVKEFPTSWSIWHISYTGAKMPFMRMSRPFSEWMGGNGWRAYPACQSFNNTPFLHLGYIPEPVFPAWIWSTSKIWNRQRVESFQAHLSACFSVKTGPDMASDLRVYWNNFSDDPGPQQVSSLAWTSDGASPLRFQPQRRVFVAFFRIHWSLAKCVKFCVCNMKLLERCWFAAGYNQPFHKAGAPWLCSSALCVLCVNDLFSSSCVTPLNDVTQV